VILSYCWGNAHDRENGSRSFLETTKSCIYYIVVSRQLPVVRLFNALKPGTEPPFRDQTIAISSRSSMDIQIIMLDSQVETNRIRDMKDRDLAIQLSSRPRAVYIDGGKLQSAI